MMYTFGSINDWLIKHEAKAFQGTALFVESLNYDCDSARKDTINFLGKQPI